MNRYEIEKKMRELREEISDAERRLAHKINRKREIQAMNARNRKFQRELERSYSAEMASLANYLKCAKSELEDLERLANPPRPMAGTGN